MAQPLHNGNGQKCVPNYQNNLSKMASFLSHFWKSQEWPWNLICKALMINIIAAIVFWLCSIYTATVSKTRPRVCLVCQINILFQNIIKFFGHFFSMYIICNWINIMGYSKHEHSTINMLYSLTRLCQITSLPPHKQPPLHNYHFLLFPRWPL